MRIVVVEDDRLQAGAIGDQLEECLPGSTVLPVPTERAFLELLPELVRSPPDLIVLDVMLQWDEPGNGQEQPPADVQESGFYRSGFRCVDLLLHTPETQHLPIIIYTVLDMFGLLELGHLPPNVIHLTKHTDLQELVLRIRSLVPSAVADSEGDESWATRIWRSIEAKPGWGGFSLDLKRALRKRKRR